MRSISARLRLLTLLVALCVPALGGVAHAQASSTPHAPTAVASAARQQTASDDKLPIIRQAFDLLYGGFIYPLTSKQLLSDAWDGVNNALVAAQAQPVATPAYDGNPADDFAAFSQAFKRVVASGLVSQTELAYSAMEQMTSARNSCHTAFLRPDRAAGIDGSEVHQQTTDIGMIFGRSDLIVYRVYPDGPAALAGVHEGDTILSSNGQSTDKKAIRRTILSATAGKTVNITVQRPGVDQPIALAVTPEVTVLPFIRTSIVAGDIGVIEFDDFTEGPGLVNAIKDAISQFEQQGVTGWVLDVRTNSGGDERTMAAIASLFMAKGRILTDFDRAGIAQPLDVDAGETLAVQRPLVVLTEQYSASAADFLPGALQDDGRAMVIGTPTDGCVSGSRILNLPDGSLLQVQVVRSLVGNDNLSLDGVGVTPDQTIVRTPDTLAAGDDVQMDAAVQYLHGLTAR
jgi:carboxyl-terminal processing protease